jgi:hypothetical protein
MTTLFVVCFIAGLGLSVVSFVSGMHHGHHLHLPKFVRHAGVKRGTSMINAAAATAFLTWFTRRVAGARSEAGRAIAKGTEVIVTRYERGIAYVSTWDELKEELS